MIRLEIRSVVEIPCCAPGSMSREERLHVLRDAVDRVVHDPVGFQSNRECAVTVTGHLLDGVNTMTCMQSPTIPSFRRVAPLLEQGAHASAA